MSDPALKIYVASVALLALKMLFLTVVTVVRRGKAKAYVLAEDAKCFKGEQAPSDSPDVERAARAHRNDTENNVLFFVLAGLYLLTQPPVAYVQSYCYTFVIARYLHTGFYLAGMQPWRTAAFVVGLLANLGLTVQLLMAAFG